MARMEIDMNSMQECVLCNRKCRVDRTQNQHIGYCGMGQDIYVARASLHMWEEPCISGVNGSGTVFFTGCSLKCVYCQNRSIALGSKGFLLSTNDLCDTFLRLQDAGAHNINLVTPTHYVPQIIKALSIAKQKGLALPIVYNTGSYEQIDTLKMLDGYIDVYMPDLKYKDSIISKKYSNASDYFDMASAAIEEMVRQTGDNVFDNNLMKKGVIVRHMILPGSTKDSKAVIKYLYEKYADKIYISIMSQYTPLSDMEKYPEINRRITAREYNKVVDYAIELGVSNAFIQDRDVAKESFIPDFDDSVYLVYK